MANHKYALIYALPLLLLAGCFTGVESTPKITKSDVAKANIRVTEEQKFLADIQQERPSQWTKGKKFLVTDNKISYVLKSDTPTDTAKLKGTVLAFNGLKQVVGITGDGAAEIDFTDAARGTQYYYRPEISYGELLDKEYIDIPFTIDLALVDSVRSRIVGNQYYITTPLWYSRDGTSGQRRYRHVAVVVDGVEPGNSEYPLRVLFHMPSDPTPYSVFMSVGDKRTSTRNFDKLFAFEDPRTKYPTIKDDTWRLIVNSKVKYGMTKDECRLALGAPAVHGERPTTSGMVEYWQYSDGVYLVFQEGLLSVIR